MSVPKNLVPMLDYLAGKRILILGMGREGRSSLNFLRRYEAYLCLKEVTLADDAAIDAKIVGALPFISASEALRCLGDYDLVLKSPGITFKHFTINPKIPGRLQEFPQTEISGQIDLFLRFPPVAKIAAVSGTKGKSTTTSLLYAMLSQGSKPVYLRGNIGVPVFEGIEALNPQATMCLELSAHQLEFVQASPQAAALVNFYPEHLDHYRSYNDYIEAKLNILRYQRNEDLFVMNSLDPDLDRRSIKIIKGRFILLTSESNRDEPLVALQMRSAKYAGEVCIGSEGFTINTNDRHKVSLAVIGRNRHLIGRHHVLDAALAAALALNCGASDEEIQKGIDGYQGLPHRCEWVAQWRGVDYYNDSIATIPESCGLALKTLGNVSCLLIGGMDRGLDYKELAQELFYRYNLVLLCMPDTGAYFADYFAKRGGKSRIRLVRDVREAVRLAAELAPPGTSVLLSPAAASYNQYRNFEERGNAFKAEVLRLGEPKAHGAVMENDRKITGARQEVSK